MKIWKGGLIITKSPIIILGLESSCDDTAVAVLSFDEHCSCSVLSNIVVSHCMQEYGGVVPEFAARAHVENMPIIIRQALAQAGLTMQDIDLISFTRGPGLIGGLIVSTVFAKMLASALNVPIIAVNHLEGHLFSPMLEYDIKFPFLALLVTGGHSQFILANDVDDYQELGGTIDDAVGESFDKVARMLGLCYPGGRFVEEMAIGGDSTRFKFPQAMIQQKDCNFSCSGLKTAVKLTIDKIKPSEQDIRDICASFQFNITGMLLSKLRNALLMNNKVHNLVVVGGVAANKYIRSEIDALLKNEFNEHKVFFPSMSFCSDNAAMIAMAAYKKLRKGHYSGLGAVPDPSLCLSDCTMLE